MRRVAWAWFGWVGCDSVQPEPVDVPGTDSAAPVARGWYAPGVDCAGFQPSESTVTYFSDNGKARLPLWCCVPGASVVIATPDYRDHLALFSYRVEGREGERCRVVYGTSDERGAVNLSCALPTPVAPFWTRDFYVAGEFPRPPAEYCVEATVEW